MAKVTKYHGYAIEKDGDKYVAYVDCGLPRELCAMELAQKFDSIKSAKAGIDKHIEKDLVCLSA